MPPYGLTSDFRSEAASILGKDKQLQHGHMGQNARHLTSGSDSEVRSKSHVGNSSPSVVFCLSESNLIQLVLLHHGFSAGKLTEVLPEVYPLVN